MDAKALLSVNPVHIAFILFTLQLDDLSHTLKAINWRNYQCTTKLDMFFCFDIDMFIIFLLMIRNIQWMIFY